MKKDSSGFTLIEVIIVVAIFGILGATIYPEYVKYSDARELDQTISDLASNCGLDDIGQALEVTPAYKRKGAPEYKIDEILSELDGDVNSSFGSAEANLENLEHDCENNRLMRSIGLIEHVAQKFAY